MNLILYIGIFIYIYCTVPVAAAAGIEQVGTTSSLVIFLLSIINIINNKKYKIISRYKVEYFVLFVALVIMSIKLIMSDFSTMKQVIFFLVLPVISSMLLNNKNQLIKKNIAHIVIFFYITECLLAIYERTQTVLIFPYTPEDILENINIKTFEFRSNAFLGHPLLNALCVSIIMGFILTTPMTLIKKMSFIILGYAALLCFNARGAILIWTFVIILYLIAIAFSKSRKELTSFPMITFFLIAISSLYEMIINQGFGDRFFNNEVFLDGSAMTRVDAFNTFSYINGLDFWLGNPSNYNHVMNALGAGGVENSYIVVIINYGIVMALLLFIALYFWIRDLLEPYSRYNTIIIITSFILVGSLNNSLSSSTSWVFFVLCVNSFPSFCHHYRYTIKYANTDTK